MFQVSLGTFPSPSHHGVIVPIPKYVVLETTSWTLKKY
jgi:hypothetical protein